VQLWQFVEQQFEVLRSFFQINTCSTEKIQSEQPYNYAKPNQERDALICGLDIWLVEWRNCL